MISRYIASLLLIVAVLANLQQQAELAPQSSTETYRTIVLQQNHKLVETHNANPSKSFTMKNYPRFASLTHEQRNSKYLIKQSQVNHPLAYAPRPQNKVGFSFNLPIQRQKYVNWTARGKVTPVKDQGYCGSCYAYSAIADIESSYLFRNIELNLSEQQIIDCSQDFGNFGCEGGWMGSSFAYAMLKGISSSVDYPNNVMTQQQGIQGSCSQNYGKFRIKSYRYTSQHIYDCGALSHILQRRPVTVAVAVDANFYFYSEGILDECGQEINHGVLLTGLKQNEAENYWMIKNSWGVYWGEQGYARLNRNKKQGNLCEICYAPSYSII